MIQYIKDFWYFIKFILTQDISLFFYRKYFVNFIEEIWPGVKDKLVARVEVYRSITGRSIKEIQICTDKINRYDRLRRKYDFRELSKRELSQLEGEIEFLNTSAYSIGYDYRYRKGLSIQLNDKLYALQCPYCKKEKLKWINWYKSKEQNTPLLMICESCEIVLDIDLVNIGRRIV